MSTPSRAGAICNTQYGWLSLGECYNGQEIRQHKGLYKPLVKWYHVQKKWVTSAIFKKYLQLEFWQWILLCVLLQWNNKSGQVSICRIGPFPCEFHYNQWVTSNVRRKMVMWLWSGAYKTWHSIGCSSCMVTLYEVPFWWLFVLSVSGQWQLAGAWQWSGKLKHGLLERPYARCGEDPACPAVFGTFRLCYVFPSANPAAWLFQL
jgi:hypothetical protein